MAVLLHVQGHGRDPLRPFGGNAVRTVAWERFHPATVGRDVDIVVVSAADPVSAVDLVSRMRESGDTHDVLLVADGHPGWRDVAGLPLEGTAVVMDGLAALPEYLPRADYPVESGGWDSPAGGADVIDLRPRVPRGPGRNMLHQRVGDRLPEIAPTMQEFAARIRGVEPSGPFPAGAGATRVTSRPIDVPVVDVEDLRPPAADAPSPQLLSADTAGPAVGGTTAAQRADLHAPRLAPEIEYPPDRAGSTLLPAARSEGQGTPRLDERSQPEPAEYRDAEDPAKASRKNQRALDNPAVLLPAVLAGLDRLAEVARTPHDVAAYVRQWIGAEAVDVVMPARDDDWAVAATVGAAEGAGTVCEVVDVAGLVDWLGSFTEPVVLDGSDLGSEGSWVLAAPVRHDDRAVALLLAWRGDADSMFDGDAVSTMADLAVDAATPLSLTDQLRTLTRALADIVG